MGLAPLAFTGVSTFSSDLQSILSRAAQIAQLPVQQLQNKQSDLLQKEQLLTGLNSVVDQLGTSVTGLGALGANKGLVATSSDTSMVTVANTGATSPTTYTISDITSIAKPASETSLSGYADSTASPVSTSGNLQLVIGGTTVPITLAPDQNNLVGLRNAINNLGAGVTASILTTGTGAAPNFLTISANGAGATTLKVQDLPSGTPPPDPVDLLTNTNQGSNTVFKLNGVPVSKTSTAINDVVPGVSFTILNTTTTGQTVTLSLGTDRTQLSGALTDFVSKYNAAVDQVDAQIGPAAGQLSGDFIIRQVQDDLRQLTSYQGTGNIKSLAALGISLDKTGKMSFGQTAFNSLSDAQVSDGFSFLGSATSGFGALASKFTQLSDPVSGLIHTQQDGYTRSDKEMTDQITNLQDRITISQNALTQKIQVADSLLASLQSQQSMLTASIQSVNFAAFGKNNGS
jgi:flagellar hook-associated protein 2